MDRIIWIDYMKVWGIWLIVLGHFFPEPGTTFIFSFHVPLFFIISGFLHSSPKGSFIEFMRKNMRALLIPYFLINALCLAGKLIYQPWLGLYPSLVIPIAKTLVGATQTSISSIAAPTWFIYTLFLVKMIMYFCKTRKRILYASLLSIAIAHLLILIPLPNPAGLNIFITFPMFTLGVYFSKTSIKNKSKEHLSLITKITSAIILFVLLCFTAQLNDKVWCYAHQFGKSFILYIINALLGTVLIYFISNIYPKSHRFITIISSGTILILGFHQAFIMVCMQLYKTKNLMIDCLYTTIIIALFIPLIYIAKRYFPSLIGKR